MIVTKKITIESIYPGDMFLCENDKKYPTRVHLLLEDSDSIEVSEIEFVALWIENPTFNQQNTDYYQFKIGDYRITNFYSRTKGHGTYLHNFLRNEIKEKFEGKVVNIYSSKRSGVENIEFLSGYAIPFWDKRVNKSLAVFDSDLDRYKLLFRNSE